MKKLNDICEQAKIVEYEIQYLKALILKSKRIENVQEALLKRVESIEIDVIDLHDILDKIAEIYK